jgi:hypothetical protein
MQVRTHTWARSISPKLKSWQDLSIKFNTKVIEEIIHRTGLGVDGCLHFHLHGCKVIHPLLESYDPPHRIFPNQ